MSSAGLFVGEKCVQKLMSAKTAGKIHCPNLDVNRFSSFFSDESQGSSVKAGVSDFFVVHQILNDKIVMVFQGISGEFLSKLLIPSSQAFRDSSLLQNRLSAMFLNQEAACFGRRVYSKRLFAFGLGCPDSELQGRAQGCSHLFGHRKVRL